MLITQEIAVIDEEETTLTVHHADTDLKTILYDEALKIAESVEDAKALAEEAYNDFLAHHALSA
ncbi:MAG: hypothetical protein ACE5EN_00720 [Nitrospinota bacterium]